VALSRILKMFGCLLFISVLCSSGHMVQAVPIGTRIVYEGKGAGEVIFDGTVHAQKRLTCADCHEQQGFLPALFETTRDGNIVTMRKMEMGRSCGYCHAVSMKDMSSCSFCHHKS
jgi:c(7)-type cytochrome triheme protein